LPVRAVGAFEQFAEQIGVGAKRANGRLVDRSEADAARDVRVDRELDADAPVVVGSGSRGPFVHVG
jgi:hypothetical protein